MKINELQNLEVEDLLRNLREWGVLEITLGDVKIKLGEVAKLHPFQNSVFTDELEKSPCGHEIWETGDDGLCLYGCIPDKDEDKN
jgi:hypothetical protein